MGFAYNIYSNSNDGFDLIIENYMNSSENKILYSKRGPLKDNRWYYHLANITLSDYEQFRVNVFTILII